MGAERGGRPDDGPEVARVGDAVDRDDQGGPAGILGPGQQVLRMGVLVRRNDQGKALMDGVAGQPVELRPGHLEQGDATLAGLGDRLGHPFVGGQPAGDIQRGGRHSGPERLDDRVPPDHGLRQLGLPPCRASRRPGSGLAVPLCRSCRASSSRVALACLRRRCRTPALNAAPGLPARADDGALLGARLAHRAPPLGITRHHASTDLHLHLNCGTADATLSVSAGRPRHRSRLGRRPTRPVRPWCPRSRIRPPPAAPGWRRPWRSHVRREPSTARPAVPR